jgi:hypothetical protein
MPTVVERGRTLGRERVESMIGPARGGGREDQKVRLVRLGQWGGGGGVEGLEKGKWVVN